MTLRSMRLADLLLTTKDGDWGSDEPAPEHSPFYVIRGADFPEARERRVDRVPLRYLPDKTVHRRTLVANDILLETAGGTPDRPTGRTLLVTQDLLDQFDSPVTCASFARFLRADPALVDPGYLFWYLQAIYAAGETFEYQVQHTGVARFQYTAFAQNKQIPLPCVSQQQGIAEVLGALDDKIAANTKLVSTVEGLAGNMFRGLMSSSTKSSSLGSILTLEYGKPLPAGRRRDGAVAVYGSGGVVGSHDQALLPGPGVVVGRKGTAGAVHWAAGAFYPIDTTFYVVPSSEEYSMIYCYFVLRSLGLDEMNSDSAVPGLNRNEAHAAITRIPEIAAMRAFGSAATLLFQERAQLQRECESLADTRDVLLPLLMSGKIRVRDVEQIVGDVV